MSELTDVVTMRFCFNKSETEKPTLLDLHDHELDDLNKCFKLNIEFAPQDVDLEIKQIEILYDGVTRSDELEVGCYFDDEEFVGYPTPIITFKLNKKVDVNTFKQDIFYSYVSFISEKMMEMDLIHMMEDYNGYSNPLTDEEKENWVEWLEDYDILCGKVIDFPDGIPKFGYVISGEEFIKQ
jgi:hypothetical protein